MTENDPNAKQIAAFLRAFKNKPPGYDEFVKELQAAKRIAHDKKIIDRQVREALHAVFPEEKPETKRVESKTKPGEHEQALRQSGRNPRGTRSKLSPPQ
jgi:hypothetical protein